MMAVSDSSPLILYTRIGRLELLRDTFTEIVIPPAVWEEVVVNGADRIGAAEVARASWIRQQVLSAPVTPHELHATLGHGEIEAVALAEELGKDHPVILDDRRARYLAYERGLEVIGSAGLLVRAKRQGLVPRLQPVLNDLQDAGLYLSEALIHDLLSLAGEL